MRSMYISPMLPIKAPHEAGGMHLRASTLLHAVARISDAIDLVQIVPEDQVAAMRDVAGLSERQSDFWGVRVQVHLVARRKRAKTRWNHYGIGIVSARQQTNLYPFSGPRLAEQVGQHLDTQPDLVIADRLDAMMPILSSGRKPRRLVYDFVDIYSRVHLRAAIAPPLRSARPLLALQTPALILAERAAVARSTVSFVCSTVDAAHLRSLCFPRQVVSVPNAIAIPPDPPDVCAMPTLLYLGSFHHPPNVIAAERLVRRIWPLVRARVPAARLFIAGGGSNRLASAATAPAGVEYLGFVYDIAALYERTRVVCTPISTGSGTRLKLLEAASYQRPIVSTRIGAEGLDFTDGRDILLRESDAALADACVTLLEDDALCLQYGAAARELIGSTYDRRQIEDQIVNHLRSLA